jgi:uncharacterized protein YdaU (DUF1376 family)
MSKAWMPLYIGDIKRKTDDLGPLQYGIYVRLIEWAWDHHGEIPLDITQLSNITRCERRFWWRFGAPIVARFFDTVDASTAIQKRVVTELRRSAEISNKRKAAALQKHSKSSAFAEHLHTQSQSQSHKEEGENSPFGEPRIKASPIVAETPLHPKWQPNSTALMLGDQLGLSTQQITDSAEDMKAWAWGKGIQRANWDYTFESFLRRRSKGTGNGYQRPLEQTKSLTDTAQQILDRLQSGIRPHQSENPVRLLPQERRK